MRIGIISDTHGYLDRRVADHFTGVDHIIHAGDIGSSDVITRLEQLAPVSAVTGNVDWGRPLDCSYERTKWLQLAGYTIYLTHIREKGSKAVQRLPDPRPDIYIYGHSHIPLIERVDNILFLNPGAAGKPRFGRPPSLALLELGDAAIARIIML